MSDPALPVRVPLVTEPWGILKSLSAARRNVLSILPEIATRQPMVSGKTGKRWHMVMDPGAIRHMLLDRLEDNPMSQKTCCAPRLASRCLLQRARIGAGSGGRRHRCSATAT